MKYDSYEVMEEIRWGLGNERRMFWIRVKFKLWFLGWYKWVADENGYIKRFKSDGHAHTFMQSTDKIKLVADDGGIKGDVLTPGAFFENVFFGAMFISFIVAISALAIIIERH